MRRVLIIVPLLLVAGAFGSWLLGRGTEEDAFAQTPTKAGYIWSAEVEPEGGVAHIVARHEAYISELRVEVGDKVENGDPLAVLMDEEITYPPLMITATSDGVVIARHVALGDTVGKETLAFEVANLGRMGVRIEVPQDEASTVRPGMTIAVHPLGGGESMGEAEVVRIGPALERSRLDPRQSEPVRVLWATVGPGEWLVRQRVEVAAAP